MDKLVEELLGLLAKASPDEWRISKSGMSIKTGWDDQKCILAHAPRAINLESGAKINEGLLEQWLENADLICTMKNGLPELLAHIERLEANQAPDGFLVVPVDLMWNLYVAARNAGQVELSHEVASLIRASQEPHGHTS